MLDLPFEQVLSHLEPTFWRIRIYFYSYDPLDASCFESWDHLDDKETTGNYKTLSSKEQDIFKHF